MQSDFMHPYFLGVYAENDDIFEKVLLEFLRDHFYWRRNFHPDDPPLIPVSAQHDTEYEIKISNIKRELHALSAILKHSVPTFHPRYIGHMCSEMILPGLLAELITTLYNPNNVCDDTAPVTIDLELKVGEQLASMFGFNVDSNHAPCAWGHLTSGGTIANFESLWNFRAVKFFPVALREAVKQTKFELGQVGPKKQTITEYETWELLNFKIDEVVELDNAYRQQMDHVDDSKYRVHFKRVLLGERIESLGMVDFFLKHPDCKPPLVMLPVTAHYSLEKAVKTLGFGTKQLLKVPVGSRMRMDGQALDEALQAAFERKTPVLAVVSVLGTTESGSIDPIHEVVDIRQRWRGNGLEFYMHVDAAWGGYLTSIFREGDGSFRSIEAVSKSFKYFPSRSLYSAFAALKEVDSITVDPHKLGYLPYGCGAFICRNREVTRFIRQEAAYVFDTENENKKLSPYEKFKRLGQYILEGSKPGAPAAAVYVTHKVLPLDCEHFGRLAQQTILNAEYFYDGIQAVKDRLNGKANLIAPFEPDTNVVCLAMNPSGNTSLAKMNSFTRNIFAYLKVDPKEPVQTKNFFASHTSFHKHALPPEEAARILEALGIDIHTFTEDVEDPLLEADSIFMLRHTLMNPWLCHTIDGQNYIDGYYQYLEQLILGELGK